jgi:hypothetical protein
MSAAVRSGLRQALAGRPANRHWLARMTAARTSSRLMARQRLAPRISLASENGSPSGSRFAAHTWPSGHLQPDRCTNRSSVRSAVAQCQIWDRPSHRPSHCRTERRPSP